MMTERHAIEVGSYSPSRVMQAEIYNGNEIFHEARVRPQWLTEMTGEFDAF